MIGLCISQLGSWAPSRWRHRLEKLASPSISRADARQTIFSGSYSMQWLSEKVLNNNAL